MLDEALEKPIGDVKQNFYLPKDKHEKFDMNLMFPEDDLQTLSVEDIIARFEQVWPYFWDYATSKAYNAADKELRELEDYDVWLVDSTMEKLLKDQTYMEDLFAQLVDDSGFFDGKKASVEDAANYLADRIFNGIERKLT